jgi:hypothetical protein
VERAELICDRSGELAALPGPCDLETAALDLLRAAHDETTLSHALSIGRSRARRDPGDEATSAGVLLLEAVIAFLGGGSDERSPFQRAGGDGSGARSLSTCSAPYTSTERVRRGEIQFQGEQP